MAPTRELAQQIHLEAEKFGTCLGIRAAVVYGGAPKGPQIGALSRGKPAIVVATPGRINDILKLQSPPVTNLKSCEYLVLDEADRMLDMGFEPQIKTVIEQMPATKQTLFFTATWPKEVKAMAAQYLSQGGRVVQINIGGNDNKLVANKNISQEVRELSGSAKPAALGELLDEMQKDAKCKVMVFCNTKIDCERQSQARRHQGHGAVAIHGDKDQWERERALQQFSCGQSPVMFCTDVAARGLHVEDVSLVVNYDMPQGDGVEDYVHRIGRTGRAGKAD